MEKRHVTFDSYGRAARRRRTDSTRPPATRPWPLSPSSARKSSWSSHLDLTRGTRQDFLTPRAGQAGETTMIRRPAPVHRELDRRAQGGRCEGLFLLFEPADIPGFPTAVVPLVDGAEARRGLVLSGGTPRNPFRWPASDTIRGAVVAGTPVRLDRIRDASPGLVPSCSPRWPRAARPPSRWRSCRARPCGGE